jgi:hypothetical protein
MSFEVDADYLLTGFWSQGQSDRRSNIFSSKGSCLKAAVQ